MTDNINIRQIGRTLIGVVLLSVSLAAAADPSTRVARLGYTSGAVSFSPGGDDNWVEARVNRPLVTGDRLWADADSRAELQVGHAWIRLGSTTSLSLLNIDDRITQLQVAEGTLNFRVRALDPGEIFEVDTPNLAFSISAPGSYRTEVDAAGNATTVMVRSGRGEISGEGAAYTIAAQQAYRFYGTGLGQYENLIPPAPDDLDRWAGDRDRRSDASPSIRYVSADLVGYEDLDDHGSWRAVPEYGNVWVPRVAKGWAPYHDGHWSWIDPYGWTWVDDAPWGYAVSHYGRWARVSSDWVWVPGPRVERPVYAPALVAFVGGVSLSVSLGGGGGGGGGVAWFPLGPRDVYRPAYPVSQTYFTQVNRSNTVINNTTITNVYNTKNVTNITYVNQTVPGAVTAVPTATFTHARPVATEAVPVSQAMLAKGKVSEHAAVAPTAESLSGAASAARTKPPAAVIARPVVAKTAPPPAPVPFAARQAQLTQNAGRPVDPKTAGPARPVATEAARAPVQVIKAAPAPAAPPPKPAVAAPKPGTPAPAPVAAPGANVRPGAPSPAAAPGEPPKAAQPGTPPATPVAPKGAQPVAPTTPVTAPRPQENKGEVAPPRPPEGRPGAPVPKAPDARPEPRTEAPVARPPEPKPAVPAPKPPEPKVETPSQRQPEARPAPAPVAVPEPRPAPMVKPPENRPAPEPRAQPRPESRPEPSQPAIRAPEARPQPEVRQEPKPVPRPPENRPAPEVRTPPPAKPPEPQHAAPPQKPPEPPHAAPPPKPPEPAREAPKPPEKREPKKEEDKK